MSSVWSRSTHVRAEPSVALAGRLVGVSLVAVFAAAVSLVVVRRVSGAFTEPLSEIVFVLTGFVAAGWLVAARRLLRHGEVNRRRAWTWSLSATTLALATLLGAALWTSTTSAAGPLLFFALLALAEVATRVSSLRGVRKGASRRTLRRSASGRSGNTVDRTADAGHAVSEPGFEITHKWRRSRNAEGAEAIDGNVRVSFPPRQRIEHAHLAFCPPLPTTPKLEFAQIEGPEAQVKLGAVFPYAARFDLRLARLTEEPVTVALEFTAIAQPADTVPTTAYDAR